MHQKYCLLVNSADPMVSVVSKSQQGSHKTKMSGERSKPCEKRQIFYQ